MFWVTLQSPWKLSDCPWEWSGAGASANTFGGLPNAPSIGLGGLGGLGGPKANGGGFGAGLGGFGGQRAPGNTLHAPTISVNNFGAASFGGSFGRKGRGLSDFCL